MEWSVALVIFKSLTVTERTMSVNANLTKCNGIALLSESRDDTQQLQAKVHSSLLAFQPQVLIGLSLTLRPLASDTWTLIGSLVCDL
jgi:hypothetical protein